MKNGGRKEAQIVCPECGNKSTLRLTLNMPPDPSGNSDGGLGCVVMLLAIVLMIVVCKS